jgi:hypothetical protein
MPHFDGIDKFFNQRTWYLGDSARVTALSPRDQARKDSGTDPPLFRSKRSSERGTLAHACRWSLPPMGWASRYIRGFINGWIEARERAPDNPLISIDQAHSEPHARFR